MGLAIGYSVAMSIPFVGGNLALLLWGAPYPGDPSFESRMYIAHVFLFPALIAVLITIHLVLVASRHHTQFRRSRKSTERKLLGVPMFPGQAPRSLGLLLGVAALLFLLGGLVQINPIWLWGPYHVAESTNGAQPDWYLGWLIGALRLVPNFDVVIGGYTVVPNPFWGGALFPLVVLGVLMAWPWLEARVTGDHGYHNVLDRPRDAPGRTAFGAAFLSWVFLIFFAGSADRIYLFLNWSYASEIWIYRVLVFALPLFVFFVTRKVCRELQGIESVELARERELAGSRVAGADALSRTPG
jgi:ubiquinol-cytochrome c reductase cytochrome b subunit